jgi:hypothetical protein
VSSAVLIGKTGKPIDGVMLDQRTWPMTKLRMGNC